MSVDFYMRIAIEQAGKARDIGEAPVGAVIVKENKIIGAAHNMRNRNRQAVDHAEVLAISQACEELGDWRLDGSDIFVTMEPCPMCAGAIILSRITNVYFGCYDKKAGAFGGVVDLSTFRWPHRPVVYGGILEEECAKLIKDFFAGIRKNKK